MTEPGIDLDRVLERAEALRAERGVFDQPLGAREECLSPRRLAVLLRDGAAERDLKHLKTCPICQEVVSQMNLALGEEPRAFVERALDVADGRQPDESIWATGEAVRHAGLLQAIVGVEEDVVFAGRHEVGLTIDLFPAFAARYLEDIDMTSLRMEGAVIADAVKVDGLVDLDEDGRPEYLRLHVDGKLARRVRRAIASHQSVIDSIRLSGRFHNLRGVTGFTGSASVEFSAEPRNLRSGP